MNFSNAGLFTPSVFCNVYPNPTSELLTLSSTTAGQVMLMDLLGKMIFKDLSEGKININIKDLNAGTYLLIFESESYQFSELVKVQR